MLYIDVKLQVNLSKGKNLAEITNIFSSAFVVYLDILHTELHLNNYAHYQWTITWNTVELPKTAATIFCSQLLVKPGKSLCNRIQMLLAQGPQKARYILVSIVALTSRNQTRKQQHWDEKQQRANLSLSLLSFFLQGTCSALESRHLQTHGTNSTTAHKVLQVTAHTATMSL